MSSIRPLITITILVVVGVVLYVKINEGTPQPVPGAEDALNQPVEGVPPLAAGSIAPTTGEGAAPAWPATPVATPAIPTAAVETTPVDATAATNAAPPPAASAVPPTAVAPATETTPAVPAVPPLPEVAATQPEAPPTASPPQPVNIPDARYPVQAAAPETAAAASAEPPAAAAVSSGIAPPIGTAPPTADALSAQQAATTPEQMNAASAAASGLTSTPAPLDTNPLRPSTEVTPDDRYAAGAAATATRAATPDTTTPAGAAPLATTTPAAAPAATTPPTSPVEESFVQSWPGIQAMLDRGELTEAHKALSKWYGDPSLTPTDTERVDTLLSQLAGTVVYSTEHRLAPAYVVKQGETLETIAKEHQVPWQLLAKINSIAAPDQVRPGQELKVVRGPFSAVVDLTRNQLYLSVDERYAGKFPVTVAPGQTIGEGEWVVGKKSNEQAPGRALLLQGNPAAAGAPAPQLVIASDSIPVNSTDGTVIKIAAKDADELSDILSIGSRVVTRR